MNIDRVVGHELHDLETVKVFTDTAHGHAQTEIREITDAEAQALGLATDEAAKVGIDELIALLGEDLDHDLTCSAIEALERVRAAVGSELATRLRRVEDDLAKLHAAHGLASGEPAEVLNAAEQDARSWALIEQWHVKCVADQGVLNVEIMGPFWSLDRMFFYARLPNGHTAHGRTRSDALAHAAEYCKGRL